jgi:hypothetical protein
LCGGSAGKAASRLDSLQLAGRLPAAFSRTEAAAGPGAW